MICRETAWQKGAQGAWAQGCCSWAGAIAALPSLCSPEPLGLMLGLILCHWGGRGSHAEAAP